MQRCKDVLSLSRNKYVNIVYPFKQYKSTILGKGVVEAQVTQGSKLWERHPYLKGPEQGALIVTGLDSSTEKLALGQMTSEGEQKFL